MLRAKCDKCQRVIEVTEREAEHLDGMLVCPQCLNTVKVAVSRRPKKAATTVVPPPVTAECPHCHARVKVGDRFCNKCGKAIDAPAVTKRAATPPALPVKTPPAYRKKADNAKPAAQAATRKQVKSTTMAKQRRSKAAAPAEKVPREPITTWGCLGLSILITLLFFTIYALAGAFL